MIECRSHEGISAASVPLRGTALSVTRCRTLQTPSSCKRLRALQAPFLRKQLWTLQTPFHCKWLRTLQTPFHCKRLRTLQNLFPCKKEKTKAENLCKANEKMQVLTENRTKEETKEVQGMKRSLRSCFIKDNSSSPRSISITQLNTLLCLHP